MVQLLEGHLVNFIETWGYVAVLFGSMIEGESIILTASFLAAHGYMSITKVALIAFLGTLIADQGLFFVGRRFGPSLFKKFPRLSQPAERAFKLLRKWDTIYILVFRFIYGIRIISPLVIGSSGIGVWRFVILNFVSAIVWTLASCGAGYMFGEAVHQFFCHFSTYQRYVFTGLAVVAAIVFLIVLHVRRKRKSREDVV